MPNFHIDIKPVKRSAGQKATAAAAYRAGELIRDERTGALHNHSRRTDVTRKETFLPSSLGEAPVQRARDRATPMPTRHRRTMQSGTRFQPALRSVAFYSCYIYSPRGNSFVSAASRELCARLKLGDPIWLPSYAGVVRELATKNETFAELFSSDATLVPIPGSDPASTRVWAAERLAIALHGVLLGKAIWSGIQRCRPVRKSATALNADRPTTQRHYDSLSVRDMSVEPHRIILIDDVITKGRTILAAAARLHEAFPNADIRAFALVRTMGFLCDVSRFLEPCKGFVRWAGGDARRDP